MGYYTRKDKEGNFGNWVADFTLTVQLHVKSWWMRSHSTQE